MQLGRAHPPLLACLLARQALADDPDRVWMFVHGTQTRGHMSGGKLVIVVHRADM